MTDAINAMSEGLGERELDAVSGGWFCIFMRMPSLPAKEPTGGGMNDPAQQFQQIMQQLTQG
jgi:hypothetical protein